MDHLCCFDCRFFVPEGKRINDLTDEQWDECLEGQCRVCPPTLGPLFTDSQGHSVRGFGVWPRVKATDCCCKLEPREKSEPACETIV